MKRNCEPFAQNHHDRGSNKGLQQEIPHLPLPSGQEIGQGHHKSHMLLRDSGKGAPAPSRHSAVPGAQLAQQNTGGREPLLVSLASAGRILLIGPQ